MPSDLRIRPCRDRDLIRRMDDDNFDLKTSVRGAYDEAKWWVAWDGETAAAFAGAYIWTGNGLVYFDRCGVMEPYRGQGLQRRMIRTRLQWAKRLGIPQCRTYTTPDNLTSANNLIACGFRLHEPERKYGGKHSLYWFRRLDP